MVFSISQTNFGCEKILNLKKWCLWQNGDEKKDGKEKEETAPKNITSTESNTE